MFAQFADYVHTYAFNRELIKHLVLPLVTYTINFDQQLVHTLVVMCAHLWPTCWLACLMLGIYLFTI